MRVGDAERDRTIAALKRHTTDGRLTLEEFSDRMDVVLTAQSASDLTLVLADLPDVSVAVEESNRRRPTTRTVAFLGGSRRDGRWRVSGRTSVIAFLGGAELDLRDAEIDGDVVDISVTALMGGVKIHVPPGVEVELRGFSFMGGRETKLRSTRRIPGAPLIRVTARCIMGGLEVTDKPRQRALGERMKSALTDAIAAAHDELGSADHAGRSSRPLSALPGLPRPASPLPPVPGSLKGMATAALGGAAEAVMRATSNNAADTGPVDRPTVAPTREPAPEGTVTVLFTDLRGSTEMTERLGDVAAAALIHRHNELIDRAVGDHGGRVVKTIGDGFMVAFTGAGRALECAIAIQRSLAFHNNAEGAEPLDVRMGLHTGEAVRNGDDLLGRTVIVASRMVDVAEPGQILVSGLVRELVRSTGTFLFGPPAEVELKGLTATQVVYPARW